MVVRPLRIEELLLHNSVVDHPVQSWEWGEFRKKTGIRVERIGIFEHGILRKALQVTFHKVPILNRYVGYYPRGFTPDEDQLYALDQLAKKYSALFIKLEPDVATLVGEKDTHKAVQQYLLEHNCKLGKQMFSKYSFLLDLTKPEEVLFENLTTKTRYNVKLAIKKGVQVFENTTAEGMEQYITILQETTKRKGFYLHSPQYFRDMWEALGESGMLRIFNAVYEGTILASWIVFIFNGKLYYPYGASRTIHKELMASNLLMWEMILFGKKHGCTVFDMWGSLGPNPDPNSPWFGFHRFKKGYGGELMEYVGSFDYISDIPLYNIFRLAEDLRWKMLRLKTKLGI